MRAVVFSSPGEPVETVEVELVTARRPLEAAAASLDDLGAGLALRTLLIP